VRRAKSKVQPVYPELARKMNIGGHGEDRGSGLPNGTVKDAKVVGGHPVLASAALDAVKKWRFEPARPRARAWWISSSNRGRA
jgi:TonB family protein